jgi:hypothetical protein
MKNVNLLNFFKGRRDIYPNGVVVSGNELEDRFPYLSEPDDNNLISCFHDL